MLLLLFIGTLAFASAEALGSFSGRVWNDINNDGLMDETEPGVGGVALALRRADTGETITVVSDEAGAFIFSSLFDGSYRFSVDVPRSMLFARYRKEGGDLRSVLTGEENDATRTYVISGGETLRNMNVGLVDSAILKGMAFLDLNYNGNYDEGEPPYSGVVVEVIRNASERSLGRVYTGADGLFSIDSVRSGNYRLRAILPDDGSTFTCVPATPGVFPNLFAARPGRRENSIPSIDTENGMVYEYYVGVAVGGTIAGTVFSDEDYSGILERSDRRLTGVTVDLVGLSGALISETKTTAKGEYLFTGVMPGEYALRFIRKPEYAFTKYRPQEPGGNDARLSQTGEWGETEAFSFSMGETKTDLNAGLVQSATLGGVFFYDENDNGLMDANEGGFTDGQVRLLSSDGEIDITQAVNADGTYFFSGVVPTEYTIIYLLPEHAEMAKVVNGGNTLAHQGLANAIAGLSLKAKKNYTQPLVGAVKLGTFEGYVFEDLNANGVRDNGEAALSGVTVSVSPAGAREAVTADTTDADGLFSLIGLRPGNYMLEITLPESMIFAGDILASGIPLGATGTYSNPVLFGTLLRRTDNGIGAVMPATLQASVWLDENRNGAQDPDERMLDGLEYALYDSARAKYVMTARAGEDGTAVFFNVRPSTYTVSFELPADAQPVSGAGTFMQDGRTMKQTGVEIHAGEHFTGISGGLICTTSIGGVVAADLTDRRSPVSGVEVRLYLEGNPQLLQSTKTDTQGAYRFDGLWPGNYVIEVIRPGGYVFIRPNDPALKAEDSVIRQISDEFGTGDPFPLYMAQDQLAHQVVLTIPAKVGNLVWLDENQNGLIDGDEPMISGVTIHLKQDGAAVYTTTSNEWGYYEFSDVYPGEYTLEAAAYPELAIAASVPELRMISSCLKSGDGTLAASDPFSVTSASVNFFYHLGYVLKEGETKPPAITEGPAQVWTRP
ncbi:MAG: SdrD B-like domain-containing protein [Bacillota bacterium]